MAEPAQVYKAIAAVAKDMAEQGVSKSRTNEQQHYKFRGIDEVMNALAPSLSRHGLMILPRVVSRAVTERPTRDKQGVLFYIVVESEFDFVAAEDGSKHTVKTFGEAMDSGDKATNKAMSAAYKYAAFQAFCIPTEGDGDNDADRTTPPEVAPLAQQLADKFNGKVVEEPTAENAPASKGAPSASSRSAEHPAARNTTAGSPACPKCGGPMWDNTDKRKAAQAEGKPKPPPAFSCKAGKWDKVLKKKTGCDGVVWPAHGEEEDGKPAAPGLPPGAMASSPDGEPPIGPGQKIRIDQLIDDHDIVFNPGEKEQMVKETGCATGNVDDMTQAQAQAFINALRKIAEGQ